MALTGTLEDVALDELMSLIQQQAMTGELQLSIEERAVGIHFRDGQIYQVDDDARLPGMLIGELLVARGAMTREQLATALVEKRNSSKPLGAILIEKTAISTSDLHQMLELQYREALYPLFTVKSGGFEFDTSSCSPRKYAPRPLTIDDVTMEAVRRIDELPELKQWIPDTDQAYTTTSTTLHLPEGSPFEARIAEREREVFEAMDGPSDAITLVGLTGMTSFDIIKAFSVLVQAGFVQPTKRSQRPFVIPGSRPMDPEKSRLRNIRIGFAYHFVMTITVCLIVLAGSCSLYLDNSWKADGYGQAFDAHYSPLRRFQLENQLARLQTAIEVFHLDSEDYPESLETLVEAKLIEPLELEQSDISEPYHYSRTQDDGFRLLPPNL